MSVLFRADAVTPRDVRGERTHGRGQTLSPRGSDVVKESRRGRV